MLAKKEVEPKPPSPPPTFDLSSDSQWPSIAGMTTSGSGSGQRVWLSGHEMEGKGWNSIVKSAPSVKEAPGATGNVLDSTAPSVRRGKEREAPKPKKPTQLRKIIELEKAAKKQLREQGLSIPPDLDVMKGENEQSGNSVEVDPMLQTTPTSQLVTQTTPTFELMTQTTPTSQPTKQPHPPLN
jgi:hypothetical protein